MPSNGARNVAAPGNSNDKLRIVGEQSRVRSRRGLLRNGTGARVPVCLPRPGIVVIDHRSGIPSDEIIAAADSLAHAFFSARRRGISARSRVEERFLVRERGELRVSRVHRRSTIYPRTTFFSVLRRNNSSRTIIRENRVFDVTWRMNFFSNFISRAER